MGCNVFLLVGDSLGVFKCKPLRSRKKVRSNLPMGLRGQALRGINGQGRLAQTSFLVAYSHRQEQWKRAVIANQWQWKGYSSSLILDLLDRVMCVNGKVKEDETSRGHCLQAALCFYGGRWPVVLRTPQYVNRRACGWLEVRTRSFLKVFTLLSNSLRAMSSLYHIVWEHRRYIKEML